MAKILLVEDDRSLAASIREYFGFQRYVVDHAETGQDALELLRAYEYDLIVLDIMLPKVNGLEVCRQYRAKGGSAAILMLTGKTEMPDKEAGFSSGTDDYLVKPFQMKELGLRVQALLKRPRARLSDMLTCGDVELDPNSSRVTRAGQEIHLQRMEFALLEFLMRHKDQVFSPETLLERVWSSESERSAQGIRTCIKRLRSKLDTEGQASIIENIHGVGYKLCEPKR